VEDCADGDGSKGAAGARGIVLAVACINIAHPTELLMLRYLDGSDHGHNIIMVQVNGDLASAWCKKMLVHSLGSTIA